MQKDDRIFAVVGACFGAILLFRPRHIARNVPGIVAAAVAVAIAVGIYLERYLVTVPSVWMEDTFPPILPFIGSALFFLGLFLLVVIKYLESVPPVPVSDPHMLPHPDDVHVHSRDAHHDH